MKRLNLKLVIGLIAVVSVVSLGLLWAHSRQAGNDSEHLKQRAEARAEGRPPGEGLGALCRRPASSRERP